jgi:hypothetical protein
VGGTTLPSAPPPRAAALGLCTRASRSCAVVVAPVVAVVPAAVGGHARLTWLVRENFAPLTPVRGRCVASASASQVHVPCTNQAHVGPTEQYCHACCRFVGPQTQPVDGCVLLSLILMSYMRRRRRAASPAPPRRSHRLLRASCMRGVRVGVRASAVLACVVSRRRCCAFVPWFAPLVSLPCDRVATSWRRALRVPVSVSVALSRIPRSMGRVAALAHGDSSACVPVMLSTIGRC